ncbi:MAG TPA: DUF1697 domain-containing protein [Gemmatimonadaceae bacterium]|nr:DUF1697 domain-containing protein [Gemmatimonadaceae bacterium]
MTTHIALLRGINVGGHKKVAMGDLRTLLTRLGFTGAQTLLQSGNAVFESRARIGSAKLERVLEAELEKRLGVQADFMVRTPAEWKRVVARNPFPAEAEADPGHLLVFFLKRAPAVADVGALQAAIPGRERVHVEGRHAWIAFPDGMGTSRLSIALLERALRTRGTSRNWNTVLKVGALIGMRDS